MSRDTFVSGSEVTERENELEKKIQDYERLLEEKDKIISILEAGKLFLVTEKNLIFVFCRNNPSENRNRKLK